MKAILFGLADDDVVATSIDDKPLLIVMIHGQPVD